VNERVTEEHLAEEKQESVTLAFVQALGEEGASKLFAYFHHLIQRKRGIVVGLPIFTENKKNGVAICICFPDCPLSLLRAARRGNPIGEYILTCLPKECPKGNCWVVSHKKASSRNQVKHNPQALSRVNKKGGAI